MPCTIIWYARLVLCGLEEDLGSEVVFWFDEWFIAFGNHCLVFCYVHVLSTSQLLSNLVVHFDVLQDWEQTRPTDARGRSLEILLAWA